MVYKVQFTDITLRLDKGQIKSYSCKLQSEIVVGLIVLLRVGYSYKFNEMHLKLYCFRNVVAHGDAREGKLANGVGSQYSHTTSGRGVSCITNADAHTSAASSRLN